MPEPDMPEAWKKNIVKISPQQIVGDEPHLDIYMNPKYDITNYNCRLVRRRDHTVVDKNHFSGFVESQENKFHGRIPFEMNKDKVALGKYLFIVFNGEEIDKSNVIIITKPGYYLEVIRG